jgi:hypothetical protein
MRPQPKTKTVTPMIKFPVKKFVLAMSQIVAMALAIMYPGITCAIIRVEVSPQLSFIYTTQQVKLTLGNFDGSILADTFSIAGYRPDFLDANLAVAPGICEDLVYKGKKSEYCGNNVSYLKSAEDESVASFVIQMTNYNAVGFAGKRTDSGGRIFAIDVTSVTFGEDIRTVNARGKCLLIQLGQGRDRVDCSALSDNDEEFSFKFTTVSGWEKLLVVK